LFVVCFVLRAFFFTRNIGGNLWCLLFFGALIAQGFFGALIAQGFLFVPYWSL
jgi:hypothetical protein